MHFNTVSSILVLCLSVATPTSAEHKGLCCDTSLTSGTPACGIQQSSCCHNESDPISCLDDFSVIRVVTGQPAGARGLAIECGSGGQIWCIAV
ncbi:Ecp40 [Fulvia fulva]|uniref:Ecp40 n=1 Tax=Passalora fulva TaxID=5499 RepID=A0A9Q8UVB5_PASFU|nr:Ecp40 [Fulvia fulva]KAK4611494.1 Ecp40 [Fulvia fulva]UJO23829.1 Ecp40 [Fulvia fulva]WPV21518.1 Ecp40 [Fulvia fulva]WPV35955.1 Ecp40 [Fulvia fulva]